MTTIEIEVTCPYCNSNNIVKNGKDENGKQRFLCRNELCNHQTFLMKLERKTHRLLREKTLL